MREKASIGLAAAVVAGVFAWFAGDGLAAYFTPDDMMNLYFAWFRPLLENDRPLGALIYRGLFAAFGLHPLPYRLVCFVLLAVNLWLLYRFAVLLTASREVGLLACLLGAYHAHLADLYYSTGTMFDLLCFTLFFCAFNYYMTLRQNGRYPGWKQALVLAALYVGALAAKEMAVTLPGLLLVYEVLYHRPRGSRKELQVWAARLAPAMGLMLAATALVVARKLVGGNALATNPAYTVHFSWASMMANWRHYLYDLFYGAVTWTPSRVVWLLGGMAAVALLTRRALLVAWCVLALGALPVLFIAERGLYALYLTLPGWYLYAACLLVRIVRRLPAVRLIGFALVALLLVRAHTRQKPAGKAWVEEAFTWVSAVNRPLDAAEDRLPHRAKVVFLDDPYPADDWILTFIFRLHYRDDEINVDRARLMRPPPDPATYDRVYQLRGWRLEKVSK